jgi:hypothetical protein
MNCSKLSFVVAACVFLLPPLILSQSDNPGHSAPEVTPSVEASHPVTGARAAVLASKDGQPPMGGHWGVRYATITDPSLPRVLLIGDSIANGYGARVVEQLKGKANVDLWLTPEWLSPDLDRQAAKIVGRYPYGVIHFNESGLHAWAPGRVPDGQYGPRMRAYIAVLKKAAPHATLIWASTTPITVLGHPTELNKLDGLISKRNALCKRIMKEDGIPVDDLHKVMIHRLNLARGDRFHWNSEGFEVLADAVVKSILPFLQNTHSFK